MRTSLELVGVTDHEDAERAALELVRGLVPDQALGLRLMALAKLAGAVHAMRVVEERLTAQELGRGHPWNSQARGLLDAVERQGGAR